MTKKFKFSLLFILISVVAVCLFSGCKLNKTLDEILKERDLEVRVTYFLNEGEFEDGAQIKDMYYRNNMPAFEISQAKPVSGSALVKERSGYVFMGWYSVKLDEESGNPLYADGSEFSLTDGLDKSKGGILYDKSKPFDFKQKLTKGHYYICADWAEDIKLRVNLVCDGFKTLIKDGVEYETGSEIRQYALTMDIQSPGSRVFTAKGYTFVAFYKDIECKEQFTDWPVRVPEERKDITIYAKYIEGTWTIIDNAAGISRMFSTYGANDYYLFDDIDCTGITVNKLSTFTGKLQGNGHKVSNLTVASGGYLSSGMSVNSVFGEIRSGAEIKDVTFENLKAEFNIRNGADPDICFVFSALDSEAIVSNVKIGGSLKVNNGSTLTSLTSSHWLFGGFERDSDFTGGITILPGTTCQIDDNQPFTVE